jgi:hypothetical protein
MRYAAMQVLAVDLMLLRSLIGAELKLAPGRGLMARVVSAEQATGRGRLAIAGAVLDAQLPSNVRAGQELRLVVDRMTADQVVLKLDPQAAAAAPVAPPPGTPIPLPGGGGVSVTERDAGGRGAGASRAGVHSVALRYDTANLGPLDVRLVLDAASLRVSIALAPGEPVARASAATAALRDALGGRMDRSVNVSVGPRQEPLDLYA